MPDAATPASNPATPALLPSALKTTLRWALILASLLAIGPLAAELVTRVRDVDGGRAVTLLIHGDLAAAALAALALTAAVLLVGLTAARFFSLGTAYFCAGAIIAWASSELGSLEAITRRAGSGKDLFTLGLEGLLVSLAAAAATLLFARAAGPGHQRTSDPWLQRALFAEPAPRTQGHHPAAALAAAVLAAGIAVWFIALSGARTQTLAATITGGIAAGAVAHMLHAHRRLTPLLPMLAMGVVALLGPVIAKFLEGDRLMAHVYDGSVFSLARPISLDWAAGALIGVPLGMSWAGASAEKHSR